MWPLILSVLAHASLLFILSTKGGKDNGGQAKEKPSSVKINIVDKPTDKDIKADQKSIPPPVNKSKVVVKKKKKKEQKKQVYVDHKCEEWYGGVGIQHVDGGYIVGFVGKGYPADRAGILVGDLIINGEKLRGEPGTHITVKVLRGSKSLTFQVVREKICTKDITP